MMATDGGEPASACPICRMGLCCSSDSAQGLNTESQVFVTAPNAFPGRLVHPMERRGFSFKEVNLFLKAEQLTLGL